MPDGWKAGELTWPAPKAYPLGPLTNYGYSDEVTLPLAVTVDRLALRPPDVRGFGDDTALDRASPSSEPGSEWMLDSSLSRSCSCNLTDNRRERCTLGDLTRSAASKSPVSAPRMMKLPKYMHTLNQYAIRSTSRVANWAWW